MNNPDPTNNPHWHDLVRRARADTPAPIDTTALLRAVRNEPLTTPSWWTELAALVELRKALQVSLAAACLLIATAGWQTWDLWQNEVAWNQLLDSQNTPELEIDL